MGKNTGLLDWSSFHFCRQSPLLPIKRVSYSFDDLCGAAGEHPPAMQLKPRCGFVSHFIQILGPYI